LLSNMPFLRLPTHFVGLLSNMTFLGLPTQDV
jgi:hypothetical protein